MRSREISGPVVLLPVLEIAPFHFSNLPLPTVAGSRDHPAEWNDYFRRCMKDAGLEGIEPIRDGSLFVAARSLVESPALDRLVREAVSLDPDVPLSQRVMKLAGGYALLADGDVLLEPGCCSDLGNLQEWVRMLRQRATEGTIWTGHPQLSFALGGERLTLTEGWENPPPPEDLASVTVSIEHLARAVEAAGLELERFRTELWPVVARALGPHAERDLTDRLTGVEPRSREKPP